MPIQNLRPLAATLVISVLGVGMFKLLHLPLPFLLGPLFGCLVAALVGVRLRGAPKLSNLMRTILGVAVGTSITPAIVHRLPDMAGSLALMPLLAMAIGLVGYPLFRKGFGFDHATAYYSAMPGGLQDMLVFGEEAGGDVRALSLIHATRVLVIVGLLPMFFVFALNVDLTRPPGAPLAETSVRDMVLMAFLAVAGWQIAARLGLFGASILGPLILAAIASLSGLIDHRPPAEAIWAAQFFIGFTVGVKYSGITLREVRIDVFAGLIYSALSLLVAAAFAGFAIQMGWVPWVEGLLAFSPGGQAEMAILAIVAGADVAFVVAHHIIRIVIVILAGPFVERAMRGRLTR